MLRGPEVCMLCGRSGPLVCGPCGAEGRPPALSPPLHVDGCTALFDYREVSSLVVALKNRNRRDLLTPLADHLARRLPHPPGAVVTWAPTTSGRRRERGYDQAELLARALARRWGLPCRGLLVRAADTAQAGRRAEDRRHRPEFRARRSVAGRIVVVDDVLTTGATLTAAARALRAAGATGVAAVVVARAAAPGRCEAGFGGGSSGGQAERATLT